MNKPRLLQSFVDLCNSIFVEPLGVSKKVRKLSAIVMAKNLDMKIVAEGIETVQQASFIKETNCYYGQGYYFEKPMRKEDFIKLIIENKTYEIET